MARLIRSQAALDASRDALVAAPTLALDTEFHVERTYRPRLFLLQLAAPGTEPVLVDPTAPLDLRTLAPVFEGVPVVVHGGQQDVELIERTVGVTPRVAFDTQVAAGFVGDGYPTRLQDLVARYLGWGMDKSQTLTDWSARPLTEAQLRYAADDVRVLHALADALGARLDTAGHREAFGLAQSELYAAAAEPVPDDRVWLQFVAVQLVDGPERAALRELAAWRERTARERDVPRHTILSDALLVELARRRPGSVEALRLNRRLPSVVWKRDGDAIVEAIRAAAEAPPPPLPLKAQRARMDVLRAALRVREAEVGVAPELLLPERLLEGTRLPTELPPWRLRLLGPWLASFLRGEGSLTLPPSLIFSPEPSTG